ncbi:SDR family oxidoreductase [Myxococcota bacterium]|nr:SDR family oxidoreductase [Myxococcota bacterium]
MGNIAHTPTTGVIVTGGASGIGRASALALAEAGRPVAVWDLDPIATEKVAGEIATQTGATTCAAGIDVRDASLFPAAIDAAREALGSLGGLVHCAGVSMPVPVDALDVDSWDAVLEVNLRAEVLLVKALLEDLRSQPGSAVVGIASINAILGNAANPAYGASKSGLLGLTRSLADQLAGDGVRVNAICPGYIETPMLAPALDGAGGLRKSMVRQSMLGRLGQPEEIGRAVRFLMSDDASFITAEHLVVDGGVVRSQR